MDLDHTEDYYNEDYDEELDGVGELGEKESDSSEHYEKYEEIVEMRTEFAKVFDIGSGKQQMVVRRDPMHYLDEHGNWEDLEFVIADGELQKACYDANLLPGKIGYRMTNKDGQVVEIELISVPEDLKNPAAAGNTAVWENVTDGVNVSISFMIDKILFLIQLQHENTKREYTFRILKDKEMPGQVIFAGADAEGRPVNLEQNEGEKKEIERDGTTCEEGTITSKFTGKVIVMDAKTRKRTFSDDVKYPVTIQ